MQPIALQNPQGGLTELRKALDALRPSIKTAFWFSIVAGLLALAPTIYMFQVYGPVVDAASIPTLLYYTLLVVFAFAVLEILEWARAEVLRGAAGRLDRSLSDRVFQATFELNRVRGTATQMTPMNDLKVVRDFIYSPAVLAAMELPVALLFLVLIFAISPLLGWVSLLGAVVQVALGYFNNQRTQPPFLEAGKAAVGAQQYADGSLRNAQVIEAMGMLGNVHKRWFDKQREFLRLQALASDRGGGFQAATKFLTQVLSSGLLGLGAWVMLTGNLVGGPAMMIVASTLGGRLIAPMAQLVAQWRSVISFKESYARLNALLNTIAAPQAGMQLPDPIGRLTVEQLAGGAPGTNQAIVRGVQFGLNPGEVLAVVGPSASGKSSLARLLVGIWPPFQGKVRLDGADVYSWNKEELGPHMGYLPQEVELFEGTLAENIARFGEEDPEAIQRVIDRVGLATLVAQLPDGINTWLGRDGARLSGGQRQRVALARALYREPRFVVLDEPNSSLDEAGERALGELILAMKAQGTTFVLITHRTSILSVVDKMLIMNDGTQQAFGPRDDVLAALAKAQQQAQPPAAGQLQGAGA